VKYLVRNAATWLAPDTCAALGPITTELAAPAAGCAGDVTGEVGDAEAAAVRETAGEADGVGEAGGVEEAAAEAADGAKDVG
jgi:hypothetical protein